MNNNKQGHNNNIYNNNNNINSKIISFINPIPHGGRFSLHSTGRGGQFDPHLLNSF